MDSLTQVVLGSAVGVAVMGRRTAVWKAALWGAVCGTLPDLDAFLNHGDPIRNMTFHRAESHSLFFLSLAAPVVAWLISRINREAALFKRWWLAVWLVLITHPLLDWTTVYGTQLALPFTDTPYGLGSMFIIDPLYTLPLLIGTGVAVLSRPPRLSWNLTGLVLSSAYLVWSALAQAHMTQLARDSLQRQGWENAAVLVTPAPLTTLLWRVVAVTPDTALEAHRSFFDGDSEMSFSAVDRQMGLYNALRGQWEVERMAWFTHGFFKMEEINGRVRITDLRMGQEPAHTFSFEVARREGQTLVPVTPPVQAGERMNVPEGLRWLWQRIQGLPVTLPGAPQPTPAPARSPTSAP